MAAKYKQMLFEQTDDNEEISAASAETVLTTVSHATLLSGSSVNKASKTASLI